MYNGANAGMSLSGDLFFYVNPLASSGNHHRKPWYGTACCPSQISRFLPSIGNYVYATSKNAVWINLYIQSSTKVEVANTSVDISQKTKYPWDGKVTFDVNPQKSSVFDLKLRLPDWCKKYTLTVNGKEIKPENDSQYLVINRKWGKGDIIEFNMDMPVEVVEADPRVKANIGRRAIQRGPIVYCLEEVDNPDYDNIELSSDTEYFTEFDKNRLNGVVKITAKNKDKTFNFIPYYAWDNRSPGKMEVWAKYTE